MPKWKTTPYHARSRGTNGEQGLKSFFRERHQFGPPVHLHSARLSNFPIKAMTRALTLSRFGGLQGRFVDLGGGKGEFHLKSAQAVRFKSCQTERNCLQVTTEANMHIPYTHISESVFFLLLFSPWSAAAVVFAFLAFFACFCGVCLFSWLIGRLASSVYRLFGRLASCFFSHANELIHEDMSLIWIVYLIYSFLGSVVSV